jgi:hypothetical protein
MQLHFEEVVPGRGATNCRTWLQELSRLPVDAPLMLEHLKPSEHEESKRHILKLGAELEILFA